MATRLYYQLSTNKWLHRIDHNVGASIADCKEGAAQSFGLNVNDVGVLETDALAEADRAQLSRATDWGGLPPALPSPSGVFTNRRLSPSPVSVPPTPDQQVWAGATAAEKLSILAQRFGLE